MAKFSIGEKVISTKSSQHGVIIEVKPMSRRQLYVVNWNDGSETELECNLLPDTNISDPFKRCASGIYDSYADFSKKNTTYKIKNSNNSTVSSLKASKTLFRAYQFKPLLKFLNSPNRRLLVADEVGLGKTIEAGHILMELKARKELKNVLIVCPKSLQKKWKFELKEKFALPFRIYDKAQDLITDLQDNNGKVKAIINYEKIRKPKTNKNNGENTSSCLYEYLLNNDKKFSLVVCDEAHKMRNSNTQTYEGAKIIMNNADAVLFLTATPVMISKENLFNLLRLLDNVHFFNYQIFTNLVQQNQPFIEATTSLNHNEKLDIIKENLIHAEIQTIYTSSEGEIYFEQTTTVAEKFQKDPLFQEIVRCLEAEDNLKNRARLQYLFASMSIMNNNFSRTRKREVTTDMSQAERNPHAIKVVLTEFEQREYNKIIEQYIDDNSYTDIWGDDILTQGATLGLVQKKRQIASSVFAYLNEYSDLEKGIDAYSNKIDSKFNRLIEIIEEVFKNGTKKIVIFALFKKTLRYLDIRLRKSGYNSLVIHGDINNRSEILHEFKTNPHAHVLLSSEVGSEGLDMQFCDSLVNYDLPWNPMVVEQRIGRIDRFGQKSPIVNIYNFIVANSIQEDIYERLLERIGIFKGTIGDLEAILDYPWTKGGRKTIQDVYNELEKELYTNKLTKAEREKKISEIQRAIENEKENIEHLQKDLDIALTNDAYFKEEINRILNNQAYVTEFELRNYVQEAIRQALPTCTLEETSSNIFKLMVPMSNVKRLRNFLIENQPNGDEYYVIFQSFLNEIQDKNEFEVTFNQEIAYENSNVTYLNIYHPIILACLNYFSKNIESNKTTFCYSLPECELFKKGDAYYLGLYQITTQRLVQNAIKKNEILVPLAFNIHDGSLVTEANVVDRLWGYSQSKGKEQKVLKEDINNDIVGNMEVDFTEEISNTISRQLDELKTQAESDRFRNEQQTIEYYNSKISSFNQTIIEWESELEWATDEKEIKRLEKTLQLNRPKLKNIEDEKEEKLAIINKNPEIQIDKKLISINLIHII